MTEKSSIFLLSPCLSDISLKLCLRLPCLLKASPILEKERPTLVSFKTHKLELHLPLQVLYARLLMKTVCLQLTTEKVCIIYFDILFLILKPKTHQIEVNKNSFNKITYLFSYRVCGFDAVLAFHECDGSRDRIYLLQLHSGSAAVWTPPVSKCIKSKEFSACDQGKSF